MKNKILLVGDFMLDSYIFGDVNRLSPEAPVPILNKTKSKNVLGGALNVGKNLYNLNSDFIPIGVIGNDVQGKILKSELRKINLDTQYIVVNNNHKTSVKTRFIGMDQQLLRLDEEEIYSSKENELRLIENFEKIKNNIQLIIISDYNKGVCTEKFLNHIIKFAKTNKIKIFVDPKGDNFKKYKFSYCIKPNLNEVKEIYKNPLINDQDFEKACKYICDTFQINTCVITRGKDGMTLYDGTNFYHIKTDAKDVYDVSGAGDTVISVISHCILEGKSLKTGCEIASEAAKYVISKQGTTPIELEIIKNYFN